MSDELRGGARDTWTEILVRFSHLIPHYPSVELVRPAKVPPPPRLRGTSPTFWTFQLFRAYHAACLRFLGSSAVPHRRLRPDDVLTDRYFNTVKRAALLLHAKRIPPAAWVEFSVRVWPTCAPPHLRKSRPTINWMFSPARIEKHEAWYTQHESKFQGSRLIFTKEHKALIAAYDGLRRALMAVRQNSSLLTEETVRGMVEFHLPAARWQRMVRAAQEAAEARQDKIDDLLKRGDHIW